MDLHTKLTWSIENNVHWHDALCDAHAVPGEHHPAYWINRHAVPPYLASLITLRGASDSAAQVAALRSVIDAKAGFGVKDSFQCLSLGNVGLRVLFHATWIFRAGHEPAPPEDRGLKWRAVQSPPELQLWEHTWRNVGDNAADSEEPRIFLPTLLRRPDLRFLLGERDGKVVATAALNRSDHAVGVSNVFGMTEEPDRLFAGCVRLAQSLFPGLPLVGYERDAPLTAAITVGFEAVHGLAVWVPGES